VPPSTFKAASPSPFIDPCQGDSNHYLRFNGRRYIPISNQILQCEDVSYPSKKESNLILQLADYSAKRAKESVYESMERLNIDHIDLINVHDIEFQASLPGGTFICTGHRRLDIKRKVITIGMTVLHFVPGLPGLCHLLRVVGNLIPTSL